jgi:uncharacterized Zn-finger protein
VKSIFKGQTPPLISSSRNSTHSQKRCYLSSNLPWIRRSAGSAERTILQIRRSAIATHKHHPPIAKGINTTIRSIRSAATLAGSRPPNDSTRACLSKLSKYWKTGVLVVVRVGSDEQFAILMKDADGLVRCCAGTKEPELRWNLGQTELL